MGRCPYDACENCLLGGQLEECHFWSPIQHTCALSSKYEENEMEDLYLDHLRRSRKMSDDEWTMEDFKERMKEMESLKKGWLDGDGKAISKEVIDLVQDEVSKRLSFCPPHIFPMESGGLSLEWFLKEDFAVAVEPSLKGSVFGKDMYRPEDWTQEASWLRLERTVKESI